MTNLKALSFGFSKDGKMKSFRIVIDSENEYKEIGIVELPRKLRQVGEFKIDANTPQDAIEYFEKNGITRSI